MQAASRHLQAKNDINENWRVWEEQLPPNLRRHAQQRNVDGLNLIIRPFSNWLKGPRKPQQRRSKTQGSISNELALELKKGLHERKYVRILYRFMSFLERNNVNSARLYSHDADVFQMCQEIISSGVTDHAFMMVDISQIVHNTISWFDTFPELSPQFHVGELSDAMILQALACAGVQFICSTIEDVETIYTVKKRVGIPMKVIDGNSCKSRSHIMLLIKEGVSQIAVDSVSELKRLLIAHSKAHKSEAILGLNLIVEVKVGSSCIHGEPGCVLCASMETLNIVIAGKQMGIRKFSLKVNLEECFEQDKSSDLSTALLKNLSFVRDVCSRVESVSEFPCDVSFVGWNFGENAERDSIFRTAYSSSFSGMSGKCSVDASLILTRNSTHLVAKLQGRRSASNPLDVSYAGMQYYIDEGCYGSLSSVMLDKKPVRPVALGSDGGALKNTLLTASTVWGPTCDGLDCVVKVAALPEMSCGNWLLFPSCGVLAQSSRVTSFNGLHSSTPMYCIRKKQIP